MADSTMTNSEKIALANTAVNAGVSAINWFSSLGQNKQNEYWTQKNYDLALEMNNTNLNHQREVLEYNKALQKTIFDREDSAYSRSAEDLKRAGLNRQLATGASANAGQVVNVSAPQGEYTPHGMINRKALNEIGFLNAYQDVRLKSAQVDLLKAQADQANANTNYINGVKTEKLISDMELNGARVEHTNALAERQGHLNSLTKAQTEKISSEIENIKAQNNLLAKKIELADKEIEKANVTIAGKKIENFDDFLQCVIRGVDAKMYYYRGLPTTGNFESNTVPALASRALSYLENIAKFSKTGDSGYYTIDKILSSSETFDSLIEYIFKGE